jgi:hypothetical protein
MTSAVSGEAPLTAVKILDVPAVAELARCVNVRLVEVGKAVTAPAFIDPITTTTALAGMSIAAKVTVVLAKAMLKADADIAMPVGTYNAIPGTAGITLHRS